MSPNTVPTQQRWLALALLITLLLSIVLLVQRVVLVKYRFYKEEQETLSDQQQRLYQLQQQRPVMEARIAQLQQSSSLEDQLLAGSSPSVAGTELQQRLKSLVEEQKGNLLNTQFLPNSTTDSGFVRIGLRAQVQMDTNGLRALFYALESAKPWLFVENVQISPRVLRERAANGQEVKGRTVLVVQFDLTGYQQATAEAAKP